MTTGRKDEPLKPLPATPLGGTNVVNLAGVRIQLGRSSGSTTRRCQHANLVYSVDERRIWCEDCERTVDGFDGFMILVSSLAEMEHEARSKLERAEEAERAHLSRRAAKALDQAWSGQTMAVACPHCEGGLLPEDFTDHGLSQTSLEIELARRARKRK